MKSSYRLNDTSFHIVSKGQCEVDFTLRENSCGAVQLPLNYVNNFLLKNINFYETGSIIV